MGVGRCILQLADDEGTAHFWGRHAAGAGDNAASYCLNQRHLSLGGTEVTRGWRERTGRPGKAARPALDDLSDSIDANTPMDGPGWSPTSEVGRARRGGRHRQPHAARRLGRTKICGRLVDGQLAPDPLLESSIGRSLDFASQSSVTL